MGDDTSRSEGRTPAGHGIGFAEAVKTWAKIGFLSFGGPVGQIALMHKIVVDEKRWIGETRFLHALNYCMLLPGPEAQQLATYIGWLLHRTLGGLVAGLFFVIPGFLVILVLSALYAGFREIPLVEGMFFGIKAAVLAIIVHAMDRLSRRALKNAAMFTVAGLAFVAIFFFDVPFPAIIVAAALAGFLGGHYFPQAFAAAAAESPSQGADAPVLDKYLAENGAHTRPTAARAMILLAVFLPLWLGPVVLLYVLAGPDNVFTQIGVFFSKMAVVTFGGAYAVLAYVAQEAVNNYGWLNPGEMLDGLGLAETTPGPLILVTEFVGYLAAHRDPGMLSPVAAAVLGALLTVWVTFTPCFLWIFLGAPYLERLRGNKLLASGLTAITAAVVGVILNLAVWFALHVLFAEVPERQVGPLRLFLPDLASVNLVALALSAASFYALYRLRAGVVPLVGAAAVLGVAYTFGFA